MKKTIFLFIIAALIGACTQNPVNPNMNTNGPAEIACPEGFGNNCTVTKGHFKVTAGCEYLTDNTRPEKITYWSIREGASFNGVPLEVNKRYTFESPAQSGDKMTCILDFESSDPNIGVNFEIIRQDN